MNKNTYNSIKKQLNNFYINDINDIKQCCCFVDENNEQVMIHPQYGYVLPSGKEKVVKILMEGETQIYDAVNRDQSIEVNTYRKIGVGILAFNNWGIYVNTDIPADNWYDSSIGL